MAQCVRAVEGCRGRTQCEERCEYGEYMCLHFTIGSQTPPNNTRHIIDTHIHHLHTFLHTGSGLYNPLQHPHCVPRPHILYNISTTLYNTLQSTALQQFYSLQPLQHPSDLKVRVPQGDARRHLGDGLLADSTRSWPRLSEESNLLP